MYETEIRAIEASKRMEMAVEEVVSAASPSARSLLVGLVEKIRDALWIRVLRNTDGEGGKGDNQGQENIKVIIIVVSTCSGSL